MRIIRVFPRRTSLTPVDDLAFVGYPPMIRPEADEVHASCTFTWDIEYARQLALAWGQYYHVKLGGVAFDACPDEFIPGMYVKQGVTFTSRGCNNQCPWCLVWKREGKLRQYSEIQAGNIIQDNNLLQCDKLHISKVFQMLRTQKRIEFSGGLDARLLTQEIADELRSLKIHQIFFAADTKQSIKPLLRVAKMLKGLDRRKLRCYVLLAYDGQTISEAEEHLENIWNAGFMPHAQLYQPADKWVNYSTEWKHLQRKWCRPAAMISTHDKRCKG